MNVIIKGFNRDCFGNPMIEGALKDMTIDTCIAIGDDTSYIPNLGEDVEYISMSAVDLRAGRYPNVNWQEIPPLDEELIESMQHCESVFLKMVGRYALYKDMSYDERKRQYYRHLRYWNHVLDKKEIDLYLAHNIPHQCYDLVIYDLCKLKGIRTIYLAMHFMADSFSMEENWKEAGKEIGDRTEELMKEYADLEMEVPLSPVFEESFDIYTNGQIKPWYMIENHPHLAHRGFIAKWIQIAFSILLRKPLYFLKSVISVDFWKRKWNHHITRSLYDKLVEMPDLEVPFVYVPLHMQPEATTCPMGGVYTDQELIVQLLAACLPDGVRIYVKEHPNQGEMMRDCEFYHALHAIPSVTLMPRDMDSFELIKASVVVASATGTACFQALFKQKPAMLFGHKYFQYAPGVYRIRSEEDCKRAVQKIFHDKESHTLRDMRIFLKAMEETTGESFFRTSTVCKPIPKEERAWKMGEYIGKIIQQQHQG
ncbi:hypothetical protein KKF55_02635 [Patescibacteria group bacterium]|nr:hypothetical protein [Patescibacteria group bacterium]